MSRKGVSLIFQYILIAALVMLACVVMNRLSGKIGIPMLLVFLAIGMVFGSDGLFKINFTNYELSESVCSVALVMIMFFGGFGTKWSEAKPVAAKSLVLSSAGTLLTAGLVGLFCWKILGMDLAFGLLIGAVISSTDAASVFSILRTQRLNLKDNIASVLEIESGSNDPFAYMLMIIMLSVMSGDCTGASVAKLVFSQLFFGIVFGVGMAVAAVFILKKISFRTPGFDSIFIIAIALISFAAPEMLNGNGYLAAYITGIIIGNSEIRNKPNLVHFFDGITSMMQILLFFLLGLLATPSELPGVAFSSILIALFLTVIARPLSVFLVMGIFRSSLRQILLVSWSGIRGAASIVFAIMAVINPAVGDDRLYHIVFFIVLFSIAIQGTFMPFVARKLSMIDDDGNVMKTFTDYTDEVSIQFIRSRVYEGHAWCWRQLKEIDLPPESIIALLIRGEKRIIPNGRTLITPGDVLILSGLEVGEVNDVKLFERTITTQNHLIGCRLADAKTEGLVIMIMRDDRIVIPNGDTVLEEGDILVYNKSL